MKRTVSLARINKRADSGPTPKFEENIVLALNPDNVVERRGQAWRLSRTEVVGKYLHGKLGYTKVDSETELRFDEEKGDFEVTQTEVSQGNFAFYVIDLKTRHVAFEARRPTKTLPFGVPPAAFMDVMQRIIADFGYDLDLCSDKDPYRKWLKTVDRVTSVRAIVKPPNPSPKGRAKEVQALITETHAAQITVAAVAKKDDDLLIENTGLEEIIDYVADGNGTFTIQGISGNQPTSTYKSSDRDMKQPILIAEDTDAPSLWTTIEKALASMKTRLTSTADDADATPA